MAQWKKLLTSLGFSESESEIYLKSLELGPAPVQEIARKAGVSRVTAYAVIEKLTKEGLMSSFTKGKKQLFVAESPERLVSFINAKVDLMQTSLKEIKSAMNELKLIQRGGKPVVKMFEGPEAFKAIQEDVLKVKPREIFEIGNMDAIHEVQPIKGSQDFGRKLDQLNIKWHGIMYSSGKYPFRKRANVKKLPLSKDAFKGDLFIYKDKIALSTFGTKMVSILIESAELADTFKKLFKRIK